MKGPPINSHCPDTTPEQRKSDGSLSSNYNNRISIPKTPYSFSFSGEYISYIL